ncbi:MAG TPA: twin-arginine translocase TatA/TatE family subunit [Planctomycetota bacterium]|nr:twin-arginine translocase TatA/TatE family subunit [Planctomycetota bacterium]
MSETIFRMPLAFFGQLGVPELIVIGAVALLLFGKRLPEVAKSMGRSIVQFKKGLREVEQDIDKAAEEDDKPGTDASTKTDAPSKDEDKSEQT